MEPRAIIFDCDGMINHEERFSSKRLIAHVPLEISLPFFKNEFQECVIGTADLKAELEKKIPEWSWNGSVDDLLAFWFADEANVIDTKMIDAIHVLRERGVRSYLATNNEKSRTKYLMVDRGLGLLFDKIFPSYMVGSKKPQKEFYDHIFSNIDEPRESVLYFDDDPEHIAEAVNYDIRAKLYTGFEEFTTIISPSKRKS